MAIARVALLIEYEGTRYCGFQLQSGVSTIQGELEEAVRRVFGDRLRIRGASRTDSGVHAKGQVVTLDSDSELSTEVIARAINYYLPDDIAVRDACEVDSGFDVRRDAISREYRYDIYNNTVRSPMHRRWTYLVAKPLDVDLMNQVSALLMGTHDFKAFTNREGASKGTLRRVIKSEVRKVRGFVVFDMVANAFLAHQVRRTVGCLIKVGVGDIGVEDFSNILNSGQVGLAGPSAPAHGLCLMRVNYSKIGFKNYENVQY